MFDAYSHTLASMGGFAILLIVLSGMSAAGRSDDDRTECGQVKRNYDNPVYRKGRAFMNAVEGAGPFLGAAIAAMLVGAAPFWVNLFASVFLVARVATAAVHIGTTNQTMRSLGWTVATLSVVALAVMAIWGALT